MKYLLFFAYIFFSSSLYSKEKFSISGIVYDKYSVPIEGAIIRALSPDSLFLSGIMANTDGWFLLEVPQAKCLIEVSYLGYQKYYKSITIKKPNKECCLDTIMLEDGYINLSEITITGKVTAMQMKGDTLEYNTSLYSLTEQATVQDLLKKLPNVVVKENGQIFVLGKEVKSILIDGKEYFSADPGMASKSLPAQIVDKVQAIERGSEASRISGFDTGEKETVLNLTVKEENKMSSIAHAIVGGGHDLKGDKTRYDRSGFFNILRKQNIFNITLENNNTNNSAGKTQDGETSNNNIGFTINKEFSKHFNIYSSAMYYYMNSEKKTISERQTILSHNSNLYDNSDILYKSKSKELSFNAKSEWNPNKRNTFIAQTSINYMRTNDNNSELFIGLNNACDTLYNGNLKNNRIGDTYNVSININYAYRLKKKGRVLSTTLQATMNSADSRNNYAWNRRLYEDNIFVRDSIVNQQATNNDLGKSFNLTLSYVEPIKEKQFLQLAYTMRSNSNNSNKNTYCITNDDYILISDQSPEIQQLFLNQRFTLNYRKAGKKTDLTMGVNIDIDNSNNETDFLGETLNSTLNIKQNTINYSPILNIKHQFSKSNTFSFDYMGTMSSPSPLQSQDYTDNSNPTNSIKGNPELKPQFSNGVSLKFMGSNSERQSFFNTSLSGQLIINAIQSSVSINPESNNKITSYRNTNGNWNLYLRSTYYTPIKGTSFALGNSINSGYDKKIGVTNSKISTMNTILIDEYPHISYLTPDFEYRIEGVFKYRDIRFCNSTSSNMRTLDWGLTASVSYTLPLKIRLISSFSWIQKKGYGNFDNMNKKILDLTLSKDCFSRKYGTASIQLSGFNLLQDKKNIYRDTSAYFIQDSITSTMGSYFMCSIIYNFNVFNLK